MGSSQATPGAKYPILNPLKNTDLSLFTQAEDGPYNEFLGLHAGRRFAEEPPPGTRGATDPLFLLRSLFNDHVFDDGGALLKGPRVCVPLAKGQCQSG
jgi:hypothetical protein